VDSWAEGTRSKVYGISLTLFRENGNIFIFGLSPETNPANNFSPERMEEELNLLIDEIAQLNIEEQVLLRRRETVTLHLQHARARQAQEAERWAREAARQERVQVIVREATKDIRVGDRVYIKSTIRLPAGQNRPVED